AKGDDELQDPNAKYLIQAQYGSTNYAQAQDTINATQEKLLQLASQAQSIQALADQIASLGWQAKTLSINAAGAGDVTTAQSSVDAAKAAAVSAAAAVQKLEAEIASKKAQATEIYRKTDADLTAADQAAGTGSIDAYKGAMEARKAAEKLSEEVSNLLPL